MSNLKKQIYIISGYSGSGKTIALRSIEELGFYCVDNLPADLLHDFAKLLNTNPNIDKIAIVIDARGKDFMRSFETDLTKLKKQFDIKILFMDASLESVTKRFKASRLKHPLSLKGTIKQGYKAERTLLTCFRQQASFIVDTTLFNVHDHKAVIQNYVLRDEQNIFEVHLMSFGFKYGVPAEADVVIDIRFLKNPFFEPKLKRKSGLDLVVKNYILKEKNSIVFLKKTQSYLDYLIKEYKNSGKNSVSIAFGCTGGRHRSVTVVENFYPYFKGKKGIFSQRTHRDIDEG